MVQAANEVDLAGSLIGVVSNPFKVRALYEILGAFCHQGRNSLNSLKLSLYLARRDPTHAATPPWAELDVDFREVERLFDRLQTICRPMTLIPMEASLSQLMEASGPAWTEAMEARGRHLTFVPPTGNDVGEFDPIRLGDGLNTFILSRIEEGEGGDPVQLSWGVQGDQFVIHWNEPAALITDRPREARGRADPLALPLLARVISAHGGTLALNRRDGLHLAVTWPLAVRATV